MSKIMATFVGLLLLSAGLGYTAGKLVGNAGGIEREAVVYSPSKGLEAWTITGPSGEFEFTLEPSEYMVSCGGRLAPYVRIRDGMTTYITHSDDPSITMESEMWTPPCLSFGQSYTATGDALTGVTFWMPGGSTKLKLSLRENDPDGKLIGEVHTDDRKEWISGISVDPARFVTVPGKTYYLEISSTEDVRWSIGMPKGPNPYPGGIAFYDGVPHPESDLGITIHEAKPGPVVIASAQVDQHFIEKGPGSGTCITAGQSFVAKKAKNVIAAGANCGFGGGVQDFIYTIYEGSPDGRVLARKTTRMVSDWGATVYFQPDEVILNPGAQYYFEYKRADGKPFYSYLSADVYPDGKAFRDGVEVEGFDQLFEIVGEVEPGGITYPYNIRVSEVTSNSARISWETGTKADGIVYYGKDALISEKVVANDQPSTEHSVILSNLHPGTTYYFRVTSFTGKEGAARAYGRMESFLTLPVGEDIPRFDKPEPIKPPPTPTPNSLPLLNGSFEAGLDGWSRCSSANPKKYEEAMKEFPIGNGPFGNVTRGTDGYKPHSGEFMYGWQHLGANDPNPLIPREDWKQEIIYQRVAVKPGRSYIVKAWLLTGDRESGWGRDSRIRFLVDPEDKALLANPDSTSDALATQWFATENEWKQVSLRFTAVKETAVIGVHLMQWWALEANYLYVDDVSVEELPDSD